MLSENLKKLRDSAHLSRAEVAKAIEVSTSTLAGYENGHRTPDLNTVIKIAAFYNVSIDFLVNKNADNIDTPENNYNFINVSDLKDKDKAIVEQMVDFIKEQSLKNE